MCAYFTGSKMKEMRKRNARQSEHMEKTVYLRATVVSGHGMHHCCLLTGSPWRDAN